MRRTNAIVASGLVAVVGSLVACSTSGTAVVKGKAFGIEAEATVAREPEQKGSRVGEFKNNVTGDTFELYDLDGDGLPDVAKKKGTNLWFKFTRYELVPLGEPQVDIVSRDDLQRAQGKSSSLPVFDVTDGELVLSPSILGGAAYFTSPHTGAVHVTIPFDPDMISSAINASSGSDLAASVFDFNGQTEAQILESHGWIEDGDSAYDLVGYSELLVGDTGETFEELDLQAFFVMATGVEIPDFSGFDLKVSVVPGNNWDDDFSSYGLAVEGNVYELTAFSAALGIHSMRFQDTDNGLDYDTTIDNTNRTATTRLVGVVIDSYSY